MNVDRSDRARRGKSQRQTTLTQEQSTDVGLTALDSPTPTPAAPVVPAARSPASTPIQAALQFACKPVQQTGLSTPQVPVHRKHTHCDAVEMLL